MSRSPAIRHICPMSSKKILQVVQGDITKLNVDVIVNAANERLLGGGGVDGAIHAAAGRELLEACRQLPEVAPGVRCPTGQARITPAFRLPARFVVHTVGPVWRSGAHGEARLLASCYDNSLELSERHGARSIAFPAISCGIYGYPLAAAARIAVRQTSTFLRDASTLEAVMLVAFDPATCVQLEAALEEWG